MDNQGEWVGAKKMQMNVVKIELKKQNFSENLAQDGLEWKNRIHIAAQYIWDKTPMMMIIDIYLISG